jgi:hypothetical protein
VDEPGNNEFFVACLLGIIGDGANHFDESALDMAQPHLDICSLPMQMLYFTSLNYPQI